MFLGYNDQLVSYFLMIYSRYLQMSKSRLGTLSRNTQGRFTEGERLLEDRKDSLGHVPYKEFTKDWLWVPKHYDSRGNYLWWYLGHIVHILHRARPKNDYNIPNCLSIFSLVTSFATSIPFSSPIAPMIA